MSDSRTQDRSRRLPALVSAALVVSGAVVQVATSTAAGAAVATSSGECYPSGSDGYECEEPLAVGVSGAGGYGASYPWTIQKDVDRTRVDLAAGGTATFTYTVTVSAGAAVLSGWTMSGEVLIDNPNAREVMVTDVAVTTDVGGGASCSPDDTGSWTVPADGGDGPEATVPYSCTFTGHPDTSGSVDAVVTWEATGDGTDEASGTGPATLALGVETDKVVDVVDDKTVPGQRILLEQGLVWAPGLVRTYTYSLTVPGPTAGTCATYTNTAMVDQTTIPEPSDTATVDACTAPSPSVVGLPPAPEVLPDEASGRAVGRVTATCQGTVRARMGNRTDGRVRYTLRVGTTGHRVWVRSGATKKLVTVGPAHAAVTLRAQGRVLDRVRIPSRCAAPEVLPETGLRAMRSPRLAALGHVWR